MTTPKRMTADELSGVLMYVGKAYPVAAFVVEAHIAALEQEVAAAETRGFERARGVAAGVFDERAALARAYVAATKDERAHMSQTAAAEAAEDVAATIRAMQYGQQGGECDACEHPRHVGPCTDDVKHTGDTCSCPGARS